MAEENREAKFAALNSLVSKGILTKDEAIDVAIQKGLLPKLPEEVIPGELPKAQEIPTPWYGPLVDKAKGIQEKLGMDIPIVSKPTQERVINAFAGVPQPQELGESLPPFGVQQPIELPNLATHRDELEDVESQAFGKLGKNLNIVSAEANERPQVSPFFGVQFPDLNKKIPSPKEWRQEEQRELYAQYERKRELAQEHADALKFFNEFVPYTATDVLLWETLGAGFKAASKTKIGKSLITLGKETLSEGMKSAGISGKMQIARKALSGKFQELKTSVTRTGLGRLFPKEEFLPEDVPKSRGITTPHGVMAEVDREFGEEFGGVFTERVDIKKIVDTVLNNSKGFNLSSQSGKQTALQFANEVVDEVNKGVVFPKAISRILVRRNIELIRAIEPAATLDFALTILSRYVWRLNNAFEKTLADGSVVMRVPKHYPKELMGSTLENGFKYALMKRLGAIDNKHFDESAVRVLSSALRKTVPESATRTVRNLFPDADVALVLDKIRNNVFGTITDPVDSMNAVTRLLRTGSKESKEAIFLAVDEIAICQMVRKGMTTGAAIKAREGFYSDLYFARTYYGNAKKLGNALLAKGQWEGTNIKVDAEIAERASIVGGVDAGGFNNISPYFEFMGDSSRVIEAGEGHFPTGKPTEYRGPIRRLYDALHRAMNSADKKSSQDIDTIQKILSVTPGSKNSKLLHKYATKEATAKEIQWLEANGIDPEKSILNAQRFIIKKLLHANEILKQLGREPIRLRYSVGNYLANISNSKMWVGNLTSGTESISDLLKSSKLASQALGGDEISYDFAGNLMKLSNELNRIIYANFPAMSLLKHGYLIKSNEAIAGLGRYMIRSAETILNPHQEESPKIRALFDGNIGKIMQSAQNNWIKSVIILNPSVLVNQAFSVPFMVQNAGLKNTIQGALDIMDKSLYSSALRESIVLKSRKLIGSETYSGPMKTALDRVNFVLRWIDEGISLWGYLAGRRAAATRIPGGLPKEEAAAFADDFASRVNIMYRQSAIPAVLRDRMVKFAFPLQTFTFNNLNNIAWDLFRSSGKTSMTEQNKWLMASKFTGTIMLLNTIQAMLGLEPGMNLMDFIPAGKSSRLFSKSGIRGSFDISVLSQTIDAGGSIYEAWSSQDESKYLNAFMQTFPLAVPFPGYTMFKRAWEKGRWSPADLLKGTVERTDIAKEMLQDLPGAFFKDLKGGGLEKAITLIPSDSKIGKGLRRDILGNELQMGLAEKELQGRDWLQLKYDDVKESIKRVFRNKENEK